MSAEPSLGAGARLGHYRLISPLGAGGMGEVFLAEDLHLGRKVAVKVLPASAAADSERRQRFIQEARAASALNHPNIVTVYEIGSEEGRDFMAMEFVDGESLRQLMARRPATPKVLEWIADAASAIAAAHAAGIVHRDIKPENLMVTRSGQVKVLDYGLAKLTGNSHSDTSSTTGTAPLQLETEAGRIMGTLSYMSPEQADGQTLDHRTDIFSLGVVLYELLTGKQPFEGKSTFDRLQRIIQFDPPSPLELNPKLPAGIGDVVARALAKDREQRYQHAGDFALDLRRLKEQRPSAANVNPRGWRIPWRAAALAAAAALIVIPAIAIALWNRFGPQRAGNGIKLENLTLTPVTTDAGYEGEPSFSPDGQTIAYVSDRSGNLEIFLKQISGGPDINLTNNPADDAQPSFSPDGKQIAFVSSRSSATGLVYKNPTMHLTGGDIWVMSAFGGSPRRVAREGNFPSWSPDGSSLIYTSGPWRKQKIFIVPSLGGTPREIPITFELKHLFVFYPSISRDGRWILFSAQNALIYVVSAKGGKARRIASGMTPAWNADSSAILYSARDRNYAIWQIPFSSSRGEAIGEAYPLTIGRSGLQPNPSRDGRHIAFAAADVSSNLERMAFDAEEGRAVGLPSAVTSGNEMIFFFDVSPTETSLAYQSRGHIWRIDEGMSPVQLTSDPQFADAFPAWSPDGRWLAFQRRDPAARGKGHVFIMGADGSNPSPLFEEGEGTFLTWSPTGRAIAYFSDRSEQISLYDVDQRRSRPLTSEAGVRSFQSFSPDGKWLAYQVIGPDGTTDIHAMPLSGGPVVSAMATAHEDFHPIFSPTGRWLYIQLDHKNLYRVPGPAQGWKQAKPEKVTDFPESNLYLDDPQFSPDGKTLFYTRARLASDVWVMKIRD